ncbi:PhzF family phenazine biosynthesis protein [Vibrio coralliilyticus]|uniref:PhzF family phenazine biosynthesis protein n=1 Tax=Vibrio coralliilyticus TaxID=190893 RepID=UPI002409EAD4|nr:PhzF family phenazine biosynthesis protein [Vibrio coralliilyticus]WFB49941.1 PhzF family phenazine biosynthesis protein [Vibrio coralliilyticus]
MELEMFTCDAFTTQRFKGNSAAVVPLADWLSDEIMQNIAAENNLSETAFVKPTGANRYEIRWFSPVAEVDFCGHATLATSYVLYQFFALNGKIEFETRHVGSLEVEKDLSGRILMTFPNRKPIESEVPPEVMEALSIQPSQVLKSPQAYFAFYESEQDIIKVQVRREYLEKLAPYDLVISAKSQQYDFISRYFWPDVGDCEDPVTGSIHAGLAPYWAEQLGKPNLVAYQASKRGGTLYCHVQDESVIVSGDAVLYSKSKIYI